MMAQPTEEQRKTYVQLTSGLRLRSQVCPTEVIIVKPATAVLTCGGHPMIPLSDTPTAGITADPELSNGNQLGKRYTDAAGALEVLVTKSGTGTIASDTVPLVPVDGLIT
jgi:hypothetical protein